MVIKSIFCLSLVLISLTSFSQVVPDTSKINERNLSISSQSFAAPDFPGGFSEWIQYLQKHLKANTPIKNGAPAGTYQVLVEFWIAEDGSITDVSASTNFGYGMEDEAIRVIKKGPKWAPYIQDGKARKYVRRQPITFVVPK